MSKILLTSGCSFSECVFDNVTTWAKHLRYALADKGYTHISSAMGSQGNGLISRGIIYNVHEALKTHKPEDILVGIMWSGPNRHDFRTPDPKMLGFVRDNVHNGWIENPTGFVKESTKNWVILNHHWSQDHAPGRNVEAEVYYTFLYDDTGAMISTLEHMLRVQLLLEKLGVPYFFTVYQDHAFKDHPSIDHPEVVHLRELLDMSNFLPVSSQYTWLVENTKFPEDWEEPHPHNHPSNRQHKEFVDGIILPWLQERKYI